MCKKFDVHLPVFMRKVLSISVFLIVVVFLSCKKNNNKSLIDNTLPSSDILNAQYSDTFSIILKTQKIDSIKIFNDGYKYLGSNQDPVFGRTDAEIYTHFSLPNNITNVAFPADAIVDSAKIILVFTENFVGDTSTAQRYQVYLLSEDMLMDTVYYSNKKFLYNPVPIADVYSKPVLYSGFKTIQIPIYKGFAQGLISNAYYLTDNSTLQTYYKGFYITTKNTVLNPNFAQGALMKIDLANTISGFYVYYHTGNPPALKQSSSYQFVFNNSNSIRMNHIKYNYFSGANIYLFNQLSGNYASAEQNIFVKGLNGTRVLVDIPALKTLKSIGNFSINRAEITFKVDNSFISNSSFYAPPVAMTLLALDSAGNEIITIDQYVSSSGFVSYDGQYNANAGTYTFNISRYIQQILTGKMKYYGLSLIVTDPQLTLTYRKDFFAARAVLGGYKHPALKPVMKLYYTPIP